LVSRKRFDWKLRTTTLQLGDRTLIMGILNVTPDSFSDGGQWDDPGKALERALALEEQGADLIDVGAESTRPGSTRVTEGEELRRLIPVLKRLRDQLRIPVSVDTYKSGVAQKALEYGVEIINDPSGGTFDPNIAKPVVQEDAGLVLNHMRGTPEVWPRMGPMADMIATIGRELDASANRARRAGVLRERIVLDPGIGFGKRKEQNVEILAKLGAFTALDTPILVGVSRKQFLRQTDEDATEFATAAAVTAAILNGAHIVRVHDVKAMRPAVETADAIAKSVDEF
jgi:dihydropteroate synthase